MLSADDLMAGAGEVRTVTVPRELLPGVPGAEPVVALRPLTVRDLSVGPQRS